MAIRMNDIEFDTVEELLKYKSAIESTNKSTIKDTNKKPLRFIEKGKYYKGKSYTQKEDEIIKFYYKKYIINQRISSKGINILQRKLNRKLTSITNRVYTLGLLNKYKQKPYMKKRKPKLPVSMVEEKIKEAKKSSYKVPEMPVIFPLDETAVRPFEHLLINLIANKGKIDLFTVKNVLQLKDGYEWDGRVFREFCQQFMFNHKRICEVLNCNPKKLKVIIKGSFHNIVYE